MLQNTWCQSACTPARAPFHAIGIELNFSYIRPHRAAHNPVIAGQQTSRPAWLVGALRYGILVGQHVLNCATSHRCSNALQQVTARCRHVPAVRLVCCV